jgi:hypothetical protein
MVQQGRFVCEVIAHPVEMLLVDSIVSEEKLLPPFYVVVYEFGRHEIVKMFAFVFARLRAEGVELLVVGHQGMQHHASLLFLSFKHA